MEIVATIYYENGRETKTFDNRANNLEGNKLVGLKYFPLVCHIMYANL